MTPLVDEERRRFSIGRLDPGRKEASLVRLEEEELVEILVQYRLAIGSKTGHDDETTYSVGDLLNGLDVIARDELVVRVEELDAGLLERPLRQQETLDTGQTFVRVVVCLLDERELLTLRLVEPALHRIRLLQLLQREDKELRIVLVVKRPER